MMCLGDRATLIEHNNMKFVITYTPNITCTREYIQDLQQYGTRRLIRVCKGNYNEEMFNIVEITVEEIQFTDGTFPNSNIIEQWLTIVKLHFQVYPRAALAVHCRSGLGRSPVLVAIALMESGMKPQDAIDLIRTKRRGSFNAIQIEEIRKYKSKNRLVEKNKLFSGFCYGKKS